MGLIWKLILAGLIIFGVWLGVSGQLTSFVASFAEEKPQTTGTTAPVLEQTTTQELEEQIDYSYELEEQEIEALHNEPLMELKDFDYEEYEFTEPIIPQTELRKTRNER